MNKIIKYVIIDILRSKIILLYTICLLIFSLSVFSIEDNIGKGILSLLNIILLIVPLICIIYPTIYVYNSKEFIELLISQPLNRKKLWLSLYSGLSGALSLSFITGIGIALIAFPVGFIGWLMLIIGVLLSFIFVAIAFLAVVNTRDKVRGIGIAIFCWLYFSILYDGLILFFLFQFSDYPLEKPMMFISLLNPIDLSRILILLHLDMSALMGYTGAIFKDYFGTNSGIIFTLIILVCWIIFPLIYSTNKFTKKDL